MRLAEAQVVDVGELPDDIVIGEGLIPFAAGRHRPETCRLCHWNDPTRVGSVRLAGSWRGFNWGDHDGDTLRLRQNKTD